MSTQYTVGKYKIVPPKPFQSIDEAVEYIQQTYPELDRQTIEKFLTPKITNDGNNKSGNLSEENSASDQGDTEAGTTGSKRIKFTADKSR